MSFKSRHCFNEVVTREPATDKWGQQVDKGELVVVLGEVHFRIECDDMPNPETVKRIVSLCKQLVADIKAGT